MSAEVVAKVVAGTSAVNTAAGDQAKRDAAILAELKKGLLVKTVAAL